MGDNVITVGRFSYNKETNEVSGPARYMEERGHVKLDAIMAGTDVLFNFGSVKSPSVEVAVLVSLQTDYAGWAGTRQLMAGLK